MNNFLERAYELNEQLINDRRHLHKNPEVGLDLPNTKSYIIKRLSELGLEYKEVGYGVSALIKGESDSGNNKVALLRADMDALPMNEINDLPYKSTNGCAHTCGHDLHASMLLTAAQIINENKDKFSGTVKLMFQPDEESLKGAKNMIDNGILENPKVDFAFAMHTGLSDNVGSIGYYKGYMATSADIFNINISGKGGHGAYPHQCITPIYTANMLYNGFSEMLAQEIDRSEHATITFGQLTSGTSFNIIPETGFIQGTVRTYNPEIREYVKNRMGEMVDAAGKFTRTKIDLEFINGVSPLYSDPDNTTRIIDIISQIEPKIKLQEYRFLASEDMAEVSRLIPTTYIMLNCKVGGNDFSHHNPGILFDEKSLPIGAGIFANVAINSLA